MCTFLMIKFEKSTKSKNKFYTDLKSECFHQSSVHNVSDKRKQLSYNALNYSAGGFTCDNVIKKLKGHEIDCKKATHNGMKGVFFTSKFNFPLTSQHKDFTYKIHINTNNVIQECTIANVPVTSKIFIRKTSFYNE